MAQRWIPAAFVRGGTARVCSSKRLRCPPTVKSATPSSSPPWAHRTTTAASSTEWAAASPRYRRSLSSIARAGPESTSTTRSPRSPWQAHRRRRRELREFASAVGPYAVDQKLVDRPDGPPTVRLYNTNTDKIIDAHIEVENSCARVEGDLRIPGVSGTGAPVKLDFLAPAGARTGQPCRPDPSSIASTPKAEQCRSPSLTLRIQSFSSRQQLSDYGPSQSPSSRPRPPHWTRLTGPPAGRRRHGHVTMPVDEPGVLPQDRDHRRTEQLHHPGRHHHRRIGIRPRRTNDLGRTGPSSCHRNLGAVYRSRTATPSHPGSRHRDNYPCQTPHRKPVRGVHRRRRRRSTQPRSPQRFALPHVPPPLHGAVAAPQR